MNIPLYGFFFFVGIALAVVVALLLLRSIKISFFEFACLSAYMLIGALVGAKLLFVLVSIEQIIELKLSFMEILRGGFVFYGGLIGGFLGVLIYGKQFKKPIKDYLHIASTVLPLGHALGRVGCFFAGCCYGIPYHGIFNVIYTNPTDIFTPKNTPLLPIQLIEALLLLILFTVLIILFLKKSKLSPTFLYLASYAIIRFTLEFFRGDGERGILFFSTSQWISIAIIIALIAYMIIRKLKKPIKIKS